jgi:hypothetical protein
MPRVALPKIWLTKILVDVLLAHELDNIGYKNKLESVVGYWHAKKLTAIQTYTNIWS